MTRNIDKTLCSMREGQKNVRFEDLCRVCEHYFGKPRQQRGSHRIYRMPLAGDPRINIQKDNNGMAKAYQVKQVLAAINRLEREHEPAK
ncbi:MAG: toxin HicA [Acidobacteria bacterium]|nr:toxin HicA [Acidobacteriota bacterium]